MTRNPTQSGINLLLRLRTRFRPELLRNRKVVAVVLFTTLSVGFVAVWRVRNHARLRLEQQRARNEKQKRIPFEKRLYSPLRNRQLAIWQSYLNSRAVARFNDSYFVATDGGLVQLDAAGNLVRHYTVLDGLPESDLLCLTPFAGRLFIGTRTQGVVSFDGVDFEGYQWMDRSPHAISALLEDTGRLLIGTMAGGLVQFDGTQFEEIQVGADHQRVIGVNYLAKKSGSLFVGTFADGLWIEEGARWHKFTTADGLLSNRIVGATLTNDTLLVASDFGVTSAAFPDLFSEVAPGRPGHFHNVATLPSLSSLVQFQSTVAVCKDNGDTYAVGAGVSPSSHAVIVPISWNKPPGLTSCSLTELDGEPWLLSNYGIHRAGHNWNEAGLSRLSFKAFGPNGSQQALASNLISALKSDAHGRLWAGSFRNGIDVLSMEGKRLGHIESEFAREINSLSEVKDNDGMLAATSQGLLWFDPNLRMIERWTTSDGLLSNAVLQVASESQSASAKNGPGGVSRNSPIACATGKGLTFGTRGKLRVLSTVQKLPSNSLYTLLPQGRTLYVGTLNGLALIVDGRVVRVFNDANSKLTHNWISALCLVGSRLFVGTYGGGIFELTPAAELQGFAETRRAVVNPNAMWTDGNRLYAGTLDGVLIFDLQSQTWTRLDVELPAQTVLSVGGDEDSLYFGTTSGISRVARTYVESRSQRSGE